MSFVVKAVKNVVKAVVNVVKSVVKAVINVVSSVISFIASPFLGLFGVPSGASDSEEAQRQKGILIQRQGSDSNIPVVYGYRKLAGTVTYAETGSTDNQYLWVAYVFAEGSVEGLREIYIDDHLMPADTAQKLNSGLTVDIGPSDTKYNGRVQLQWYPGTYYQIPSNSPVGSGSIMTASPSWKSTNVYNGMAVLFARYKWVNATTQAEADANPFHGSIPAIQVTLLGKKVASLMSGSGQENYEYNNTGYAERYSTNPAEIVLDYLRNPRYGKGLKNSEIDWASFQIAANKCNQEVSYITTTRGPILTCNYVLDTGQTIFNNVKILLANMRGYLPYVQGKYKIKIEDAGHETNILSGSAVITQTYDKDNIVGELSYVGVDRSNKYNQVVVSYVDPDQKWSLQQVVYPSLESERQVYITRDGGKENKAEITFPCITNYAIAYDFARLVFFKSRYQDAIQFKADSRAFELEPGDNIYVNANILQFGADPTRNAIPWRVVSVKLNDDYSFDLGCVRNPDFIYPYTPANELDRVLATYIPSGVYIEYQASTLVRPPIGLVPPTHAELYNNSTTNSTTHPATTDPTSTTGGGVGSNTGTINTANTNTPVVDPPPPQTYNQLVAIHEVTHTASGGLMTSVIKFNQPPVPTYNNYSGIEIYYKRNLATETVWKLITNTTIAGDNNPISVTLSNLIKGYYDIRTRVLYATGSKSSYVGQAQIDATGNITTENPADTYETVGASWSLNTTPVSVTNNFFGSISGAPILSNGAPLNPRQMSWTFIQDINNAPVSGLITGLRIYYKSSANTYWKKALYTLSNYIEGAPVTFTLPFTLGPVGSSDTYDFVARFVYSSGNESTKQFRSMGASVEEQSGLYTFDPFYYVQKHMQEEVSSYTLITEENAPPGAVSDPRDAQLTYNAITSSSSGATRISFFLNTPSATILSNWYGVRVYYKEVLSTATTIQTLDITPVVPDVYGQYILTVPVNYNIVYEYVVVPMVNYNNAITEGNSAWYFSNYVHSATNSPDYPYNSNWYQQFAKSADTTVACKAKFGTATPAAPNRYTYLDYAHISPVLLNGNYLDPRQINLTIKQNASTVGNTSITGVKIYYKPITFDYWYYTTHTLIGYTQGSDYTFTPNLDLGSAVSDPSSYPYETFDVIVRMLYNDGSESYYQSRGQVRIQGGTYPDYISSTYEVVSTYSFTTVDDAPLGAITDPRTLVLSVNQNYSLVTTSTSQGQNIIFYFYTPVDPEQKWAGARLYYRPVVAGSNPAYTTANFIPALYSSQNGYYIKQPITYNTEYEFVLTAVVNYSSSNTNCNESWYGRGYINDQLNSQGEIPNWWQLLNFTLTDTTAALTAISTAFPATPPVVSVVSWTKTQTQNLSAILSNDPQYCYYTLAYTHDHITNFEGVDIYRRNRSTASIAAQIQYGLTEYWGYGYWEKMSVNTIATGSTVVVNMRPSIRHTEFNSNYPSAPLINTSYTTNKPTAVDAYNAEYDDFVIVVRHNGQTSTLATTLPTITPSAFFVGSINGLVATVPVTGESSVYNNLNSGKFRRLDEARLPILISKLMFNSTTPNVSSYPSVTPAII